jgi:hypothetical protein
MNIRAHTKSASEPVSIQVNEITRVSGLMLRPRGARACLVLARAGAGMTHPSMAVARVIALMLTERHGIILFHDIHAKAKSALPIIFHQIGYASTWGNCHDLGAL